MRRSGERWAVAQFVVSGLAAVVLIVILVLVAFARAGREEAASAATEVTRITATTVIAPLVDEDVLAGDRAALERLDARLRTGVLQEPVLRVTIYRPDGTLVYSSNPGYGSSGLTAPMREALRSGETYTRTGGPLEPGADVPSDVDLLDVYQPVTTADGQQLLIESCRRLTAVRADGRALLDRFAPYLIGGVLALQLINLPLAIVLMRRSRRSLQREIAASDRERRRLAADLHNGVIQDMAGLSMALSGAAAAHQSPELKALADNSRRTTRALRQALVDIYPPNLQRAGLRSAVDDLLDATSLDISTQLDDQLDELPPDTAALVYRTVQEAVRNVVGHAEASRIDLRIERVNGSLDVLVADDGRGFGAIEPRPGHVGLALISDLVEQAGGELRIDSAPGDGTAVRARVPVL
jgi:signal transduction histidine kinase